MTIKFIFWFIMLLWLIHAIIWNRGWITGWYGPLGSGLIAFILFGIIGWRVFGAPITG